MASVKKVATILVRSVYLTTILFLAVYVTLRVTQHSQWYKHRLFHQLVCGSTNQQLRAASALAYLGAQDELLAGLKSDVASVRELARRGLEHIWFSSAGTEAYQLTEAAYQATEKAEYPKALEILNRLVQKYPNFAEGWNRRAAVYWQLGEYQKSLADSKRALALNPNHYGALQGMGLCRLQLGDVAAACRFLRAALKIIPHDEATRTCLQKCEDLLRLMPKAVQSAGATDVI